MVKVVILVCHAYKLSGPMKAPPPGEERPRLKVKGKPSFKPLLFLFILISNEGIGQGSN